MLLGQMVKAMNRILIETAEKFPHVFFFDLDGKINSAHFGDDCHLNTAGKNIKGYLVGQYILAHQEDIGW